MFLTAAYTSSSFLGPVTTNITRQCTYRGLGSEESHKSVFDLPDEMQMVGDFKDEEDEEGDESDEGVSFSVEDYSDYIINELDNICKDRTCVHVIGVDNASECRMLARLSNVPFIGCRSHRLSLAAKRLCDLGDRDDRPIHRALIKSQKLINRLCQLKRYLS